MARAKRNSENPYIEPLATRLRELTEETGVSQTELAAAIGVTRQAVNSYTLGNTVPNSDVLLNIAKYFDVSTDWLYGTSEIEKPADQVLDQDLISLQRARQNMSGAEWDQAMKIFRAGFSFAFQDET